MQGQGWAPGWEQGGLVRERDNRVNVMHNVRRGHPMHDTCVEVPFDMWEQRTFPGDPKCSVSSQGGDVGVGRDQTEGQVHFGMRTHTQNRHTSPGLHSVVLSRFHTNTQMDKLNEH